MDVLVNIDVDDIERGVAFYRDGLGMTVLRRLGDGVVELGAGPTRVYLLAKASGTPAFPGDLGGRRYDRRWTAVHIDVVVDDVEAALERAVAAGATVETPVSRHPWGAITGLSDPFGHGFCLLTFSDAGYDVLASG